MADAVAQSSRTSCFYKNKLSPFAPRKEKTSEVSVHDVSGDRTSPWVSTQLQARHE